MLRVRFLASNGLRRDALLSSLSVDSLIKYSILIAVEAYNVLELSREKKLINSCVERAYNY